MLAEAGSGGLKQGLGYALGVLIMIGFVWGTVKVMGGADRISKGDPDGKMAIIGGLMIAAAPQIMGALYAAFGYSGGTITPSF